MFSGQVVQKYLESSSCVYEKTVARQGILHKEKSCCLGLVSWRGAVQFRLPYCLFPDAENKQGCQQNLGKSPAGGGTRKFPLLCIQQGKQAVSS